MAPVQDLNCHSVYRLKCDSVNITISISHIQNDHKGKVAYSFSRWDFHIIIQIRQSR
jgi:hypothetical protein